MPPRSSAAFERCGELVVSWWSFSLLHRYDAPQHGPPNLCCRHPWVVCATYHSGSTPAHTTLGRWLCGGCHARQYSLLHHVTVSQQERPDSSECREHHQETDHIMEAGGRRLGQCLLDWGRKSSHPGGCRAALTRINNTWR